jgi:hypothetical protein
MRSAAIKEVKSWRGDKVEDVASEERSEAEK